MGQIPAHSHLGPHQCPRLTVAVCTRQLSIGMFIWYTSLPLLSLVMGQFFATTPYIPLHLLYSNLLHTCLSPMWLTQLQTTTLFPLPWCLCWPLGSPCGYMGGSHSAAPPASQEVAHTSPIWEYWYILLFYLPHVSWFVLFSILYNYSQYHAIYIVCLYSPYAVCIICV